MLRLNLDGILRKFTYAQKEEQLRDPRDGSSRAWGGSSEGVMGAVLDRLQGYRELQKACISLEAGGKPPVGFD